MLAGLRLVQGLAGAGGMVIARAVVRDLHTGAAAVRLFSSLLLVTGLAPILAPVAGGQVLAHASWRGIFVVLAALSALIAAGVALGLRESLPPERRSRRGSAAHPPDHARAARATGGSSGTRSPAASPSARCSPTSPARRSSCRASTARLRSSTASSSP